MQRNKIFDILYVILIISLICFMIWIVIFLKGNAKECLRDPVSYFEEKNEGATCTCRKGMAIYGQDGELIASQINFNDIYP